MTELFPKSPQENPALDRRLAGLVLMLCLAMGAARLFYAMTEPLWFDEAFTLAVISPPDFATFWREVYLDSNAPGTTCWRGSGPISPGDPTSPSGFQG